MEGGRDLEQKLARSVEEEPRDEEGDTQLDSASQSGKEMVLGELKFSSRAETSRAEQPPFMFGDALATVALTARRATGRGLPVRVVKAALGEQPAHEEEEGGWSVG